MGNEELSNENSDRGDEGVIRLLGGLKHVDAPANFERRVMARIADPSSSKARFGAFPLALRYALPLLLILPIGAFLVYNNLTPEGRRVVPEVVGIEPQPAALVNNSVTTPATDELTATAAPKIERASETNLNGIATGDSKPANAKAPTLKDNRGGGSFDTAVKPPRQILRPGITLPDNMAANRDEVISRTSLSVSDVLAPIGISANFDGGWKVTAVRANSLSERSGVRSGDVVIAIGEQNLAADTKFSGEVAAKSLRISRDGKVITLNLK